MGFPNMGQGVASTRVSLSGPQKPMRRVQTPTAPGSMGKPRMTGTGAGMGLESGAPLMGGGGMAVGPLRSVRVAPLHPGRTRGVLASGLKG